MTTAEITFPITSKRTIFFVERTKSRLQVNFVHGTFRMQSQRRPVLYFIIEILNKLLSVDFFVQAFVFIGLIGVQCDKMGSL